MTERIKILYIDDEPDNLFGFKASFRIQYEVFTAINTDEAIRILETESEISVIFCDQRMPEKTGVDFFEEIKIKYPLPVRILITAYTDIEVIIHAINNGHIYRYIHKPWVEVDIISAVEEAHKFYLATSLLQLKNEELLTAYNELDKFAYSVSHDLRSPLAGILSAVNAMNELTDLVEVKEMLPLIEKSIFRLEDYIAGMHDYYKSHRGALKIEKVDFARLMEELRSLFQIYLNTQKVELKVSVYQNCTFESDQSLIRMILTNLITNAIKYQKKESDHKSIEVMIDCHENDVLITVSDTGIGIPESHFDEIFNLFSKVSAHGVGSGIGLYNVKNALDKLSGDMEVSSRLGEGTTFKLHIPGKS